MNPFLIATTSLRDLRPIGGAGDRSYERLTHILRTRLSDAHASLFAEPVADPNGAGVDWYAAIDGPATPIDSMAEPDKSVAKQRLLSLVTDIEALAGRLETDPSLTARQEARTLRSALTTPHANFMRAIGTTPILIAWSHEQVASQSGVTALQVWTQLPPPPPPPPPAPLAPVAPPPRPPVFVPATPVAPVAAARPLSLLDLLMWLIFALLLAIAFRLLLESCALSPLRLFGMSACPQDAAYAQAQGQMAETAALAAHADRLEAQLAKKCAGGAAGPSSAAIDKRVQQQGGQVGARQITLAWNGPADLDLVVDCPGGGRIAFKTPKACGAELDVDMNFRGRTSAQPVENIIFGQGAPAGEYVVQVFRQQTPGATPTPFQVRVRTGAGEQVFSGEIVADLKTVARVKLEAN